MGPEIDRVLLGPIPLSQFIIRGFTVSELAADCHELIIPQRIMRLSTKQLDPRCSQQTHHRPNQPHPVGYR